ncbi:hypothetical protein K488DRAFT_60357 [Vararia minispora EC-137]|uniref:Uncharacterized protein n=1 Tax=Vararia minispora EC-137 TaxID=1314806 RepID=A0ACB8Q7L6_9AGAM|nr:hypothetical protein K488DRAFT_60357 [Vararia minispora EC-137]
MGKLVWHEYARLVTISASCYTVWASIWAFVYRKFFWDFVNGTLRNPGGLQPAKQDAIFITLIVKAPVIPIFSMLIGFCIIAFEYPVPWIKGTSIHRSFIVRIVALLVQAILAILWYQAPLMDARLQGTNGAIWSLAAAFCWGRAILLGEVMKEAKDNKGRGGKA